jgi:NAD(P)H-hydrate repair Nnr-like enzyme with NAD(P)H-hydrate dehydratase domain
MTRVIGALLSWLFVPVSAVMARWLHGWVGRLRSADRSHAAHLAAPHVVR